MADQKGAEKPKSRGKSKALIDPIYKKYTQSVIRSLASTDFYEFFMASIASAQNEFQFSNRKMIKSVDVRWVDAIEESLQGIQNIIANPRNIIREEEIIVNVANAKKAGSDVIRHLAQHGSLVEEFDEEQGTVRPGKLMQKLRDDSIDIYENRLTFTVLETAYNFVKLRHDALFNVMGDEFGAKLKVQSDLESITELVHFDMFVHIKEKDDPMFTDEKNREIFARISRIYRLLSAFMSSDFALQLSKLNRVKGAIVKTNVLKKNLNYRAVVRLYEFLHNYGDVGYTIRIIEQNPKINEVFERDIFHNIMFNYIVLKGYLENENDRQIAAPMKEKKRTIKPKIIREIIEELTEDYDMPDVEIRKVLIEELTKEQLMKEEAAERLRLVEEREQRKKEEEERLLAEKKAQEAREIKEAEEREERIRQEHEAEKARRLAEKMEKEYEERRRTALFKKEIERFNERLPGRLQKRIDAAEKAKAEKEKVDLEDAAKILDEVALRKKEEAERIKKREAEEAQRIAREKRLEEQRKREELEKKLEEERIAREEKLRAEAIEKLSPYISEIERFTRNLDLRFKEREQYFAEEQELLRSAFEEKRLRREWINSQNRN